jgi:hypothetical protein
MEITANMLSKNLLPNASFELDFGDTVSTNWGDTQNELALQLHLDLNPDEIGITQVPQVSPRSEAIGKAVDGERAARVETEPALNSDETGESGSAVGHLLSTMVDVTPCTPYTISVYARSDEESAKLEIGLWTHPVDFTQSPDSLSVFHLRAARTNWKNALLLTSRSQRTKRERSFGLMPRSWSRALRQRSSKHTETSRQRLLAVPNLDLVKGGEIAR